jgi:hypothetical protein
MQSLQKGFSMKVVFVALLVGLVASAALIRFGLGEGADETRWETLRIPAQLDGDYITALQYDAATGEILTGFESGHSASTARSGRARFVHGHDYRVNHIAVSPDGALVASSAGETVVWDRESGKTEATLEQVDGPVIWSESGDALFVLQRGIVKIYDVERRRFHSSNMRCEGSATAIALDSERGVLAAGSSTGRICLWKVLESSQYRALDLMIESPESKRRNQIRALAFSNKGEELLVVTELEGVRRLVTSDLTLVQSKSPKLTRVRNAVILNRNTGSVAMTGQYKAWDGEEDHFVELFNLQAGQSEILKAKTSTMNPLAVIAGNSQLVVGNVVKYLVLDIPPRFR